MKILQEHSKGAPGARLADTTELKIVHTKLHTGNVYKIHALSVCIFSVSYNKLIQSENAILAIFYNLNNSFWSTIRAGAVLLYNSQLHNKILIL